MYKRIGQIVALLLILAVLTLPTYAQDKAIHGQVWGEYEACFNDYNFGIDLDKHLTNWLSVGASLSTACPTMGSKRGIPTWVPYQQDYSVWVRAEYKQVEIQLSDWCNHWLATSHIQSIYDDYGLTLRVTYKF
jgi:hypothetical protein